MGSGSSGGWVRNRYPSGTWTAYARRLPPASKSAVVDPLSHSGSFLNLPMRFIPASARHASRAPAQNLGIERERGSCEGSHCICCTYSVGSNPEAMRLSQHDLLSPDSAVLCASSWLTCMPSSARQFPMDTPKRGAPPETVRLASHRLDEQHQPQDGDGDVSRQDRGRRGSPWQAAGRRTDRAATAATARCRAMARLLPAPVSRRMKPTPQHKPVTVSRAVMTQNISGTMPLNGLAAKWPLRKIQVALAVDHLVDRRLQERDGKKRRHRPVVRTTRVL